MSNLCCLTQNSDQYSPDICVDDGLLQQFQASISVSFFIDTLLHLQNYKANLNKCYSLFLINYFSTLSVGISETITYQHCLGGHFVIQTCRLCKILFFYIKKNPYKTKVYVQCSDCMPYKESIFLFLKSVWVCFRLLSGNPLQCECKNIWIKVWLDDSEREGLQCLQEGGRAKALSRLTLPSCGNETQLMQFPFAQIVVRNI